MRQRNLSQRKQQKKKYSDAKTYYSTPKYPNYYSKNQPRIRASSWTNFFFFLIIQKSGKNRAKNSLKKLTFTTLRRTHFESFFRKFKVIGFLFTKLSTDSKKSLIF